MTFPTPLTESDTKLVDYLRQNHGRKEFAVARRQQWHRLLPMLATLDETRLHLQQQVAAHTYYTTALTLAGAGHLSEALIAASPLLSDSQKATCTDLARVYDRQRPRLMAVEQPAVGQRITAKFKPDSYLGKYGSWHTGTIQLDPSGPGFGIPGTGGISFDDIIAWLPALDEEPHDVKKREHFEQDALAHPEYLRR